jgi:hypothetical protein
MSDPTRLPKFPHSHVANEVGLRAGPPGLKRTTSGFAVAAFAFGLMGGVLGIVFGIIALGRTGTHGQRGRWMAVTGLVASGVWITAIATAVVVDINTDAKRDAAGEIIESGNVSTASLQVGDCLADVPEGSAVEYPAVPCSDAHEGEVIGTFDLTTDGYPDDTQLTALASEECGPMLRGYSQTAFDDPNVGLIYVAPVEQAWPDRREVVCVADLYGEEMTGSLADR